jgi:hypothetical protein
MGATLIKVVQVNMSLVCSKPLLTKALRLRSIPTFNWRFSMNMLTLILFVVGSIIFIGAIVNDPMTVLYSVWTGLTAITVPIIYQIVKQNIHHEQKYARHSHTIIPRSAIFPPRTFCRHALITKNQVKAPPPRTDNIFK